MDAASLNQPVITRRPEEAAGPGLVDVYARIGRNAGYMVHVWDAVENGDEADSYFWKKRGSAPLEDESTDTFPDTLTAWRHCCLINQLLQPLVGQVVAAGYQVQRSAFGAFYWQDSEGQALPETFAFEADAWVSCFLTRVFDTPVEEGPSSTTLCP